jgi:hypothetical protein
MNEYERSECYELLREIINLDSMLKDNQEDMNQLISYLGTLKEKQQSKYYKELEVETIN